jgi:hypothetical protein
MARRTAKLLDALRTFLTGNTPTAWDVAGERLKDYLVRDTAGGRKQAVLESIPLAIRRFLLASVRSGEALPERLQAELDDAIKHGSWRGTWQPPGGDPEPIRAPGVAEVLIPPVPRGVSAGPLTPR